ncbi:MAG: putative quinol monooxygenase [Alphaproteobacteria bacterium]
MTAHMKIKPGREAEFEAVAREMIDAVRAREPGAIYYSLFKSDQPGDYYFMERWADQAAIDAHMTAPHVQEIMPRFMDCIDGDPVMNTYEEIEQDKG